MALLCGAILGVPVGAAIGGNTTMGYELGGTWGFVAGEIVALAVFVRMVRKRR